MEIGPVEILEQVGSWDSGCERMEPGNTGPVETDHLTHASVSPGDETFLTVTETIAQHTRLLLLPNPDTIKYQYYMGDNLSTYLKKECCDF